MSTNGNPEVPRKSKYYGSNPLTHYRHTHKITQKKLAEKLHISARDISAMERGWLKPTPRWAQLISDYFGIKPEVLFPNGTQDRSKRVLNYMPPEPEAPAAPVRLYPLEFQVMCVKCKRVFTLRTDDFHSSPEFEVECQSCAMPVRDIIPLCEAAHV